MEFTRLLRVPTSERSTLRRRHSRNLTFFWVLLGVLVSSMASATIYTASPSLRNWSGNKVIQLTVDNTLSTGSQITDGIAWFKVSRMDGGAFTTSGTIDVISNGSVVGSVSYSAGASQTNRVSYGFSSGFTSGTQSFYAQRKFNGGYDAGVISGMVTVTASPSPPPTLNSPANGQTNLSPTNAQFSWNASPGTSQYRIVISTDPNFSNFNDNVSDLRCLDSNCRTLSGTNLLTAGFNDLRSGTTYYWHVRADSTNWSETRSFTTTNQAPNASISSVTQGSDGSVTVNFSVTDPEGRAVSADVYLSNAGGGTNYTGREATKRSKAAYAGGSASIVYAAAEAAQYLVASQTYTARLTGFDNLGMESGYQYSQSFVYQGSSLPAPTLNSPANGAVTVSPTNAQFSWSAVTGAIEYRIVVSTDPNFGNFNTDLANLGCLDTNCRTANGINLLNTTFTDLKPGTTYYWHVRNERSSWSGSRSFTTQSNNQPPNASISSVTQGSDGSATVNFTVTDPEGSAVSADVYLSNAGGGTNYTGREATKRSKAAYAGGSASIVYSAAEAAQYLVAGQTYTARLTGFDNLGAESGYQYSPSFVYKSLATPVLSTPVNAATNVPPTDARFSWNAVADATQYRIVLSTTADFASFNETTLTCTDTVKCKTLNSGGNPNASFTDLAPATTYYWRVRASATGLTSAWSTAWQITTSNSNISVNPLIATLNVPTNFTVTGTNLVAGMAFTIADCEPESGPGPIPEVGVGTSTQRTFRCVPKLTGSKAGVFKNAPNGTVLFNFTVSVSATGSPAVSAVTPLQARLDVAQNFEVKGTGLTSGMGFTIGDCEPETGGAIPEVGTGTPTQRTFRCVPRLPGPKQVTIKTAPGGTVIPFNATVTVDHPARLGNPATRGIPSSGGVSLWNGNFYHSVVDMAVPGKGVSFVLSRSYNSYHFDYEQQRGGVDNYKPWRFNWELSVAYVPNTGSKRLYVQREDGSGENFFKDTDNVWYAIDQGNFDKLQGDNPTVGQTTLFTRAGLRYIFQNPDLGGKLLFIRDHEGNKLSLNYGTNGKVESILDSSGRSYAFSYDPSSNRLLQVTDFAGRYVAYTWEVDTANGKPRERIKTVRDVRGNITTYNYTSNNSTTEPRVFLTSIVDPRNNTAVRLTYENTVYGNWGVTSRKDANNNTWAFTYCAKQADGTCGSPNSSTGFTTTLQNPLTGTTGGGSALVYEFDNAGRLAASINGRGVRTTTAFADTSTLTQRTYNTAPLPKSHIVGQGYIFGYEYDTDGNLKSAIDPQGEGVGGTHVNTWLNANPAINLFTLTRTESPSKKSVNSFTYFPTGKPETHTPPGLTAIRMAYNTAGLMTSRTDGRNITRQFGYDSLGNLNQTTFIPGVVEKSVYDSLSRVRTKTDPLNNVTAYEYDEAGNVTKVTEPLNRVTQYVYDANGNKSYSIDPLGRRTDYTYNALNQLVKTSITVGGVPVVTEYGYDALGRIVWVKNPNAHTHTTAYTPTGKTLSQSDALNNTTRFEYDADDHVTKQTDPDGRITLTAYDALGRVTAVTTDAGTQRYGYDVDGNRVSSTDRDGKTTYYEYDPAGRLVKVTEPTGAITTASYDDNGNQTSVTDPKGNITRYTYDNLNRRTVTRDAKAQEWLTDYDLNGNVLKETAPGGLVTSYEYDAANRLTAVTYPGTSKITYAYDANDNRTSMNDTTGTTYYEYDELNRLKKVTDPLGKIVTYGLDGVGNLKTLGYPGGQSVAYAYDAGERMTGLTDWLNKTTTYTLNNSGQVTSALLGNGSRLNMAYDAAGRLNSLVNKQPNNAIISSHGLTMDGRGNITQATAQLPLQPNLTNLNRAMSYDESNRLASVNGSAVSHDTAGRITGLGGNSYNYDGRDLITAISGAQPASFSYNGEGQRVSRTLNGQTTRYVIDPRVSLPNVLAETDNAGTVLRNYVYGYGLLEQIDASNTAHYYHFDPTGHTLALTDASGAITDRYAYTPFGETTISGNTVNPFRYVGKQGVIDDGNGLHYMRARYYRADVARFMSLDSVEGVADKPQGLNRYAYVRGNPVMGVDPSGEYLCDTKYSSCPNLVNENFIGRNLAENYLQTWKYNAWEQSKIDRQRIELPLDPKNYTYFEALRNAEHYLFAYTWVATKNKQLRVAAYAAISIKTIGYSAGKYTGVLHFVGYPSTSPPTKGEIIAGLQGAVDGIYAPEDWIGLVGW